MIFFFLLSEQVHEQGWVLQLPYCGGDVLIQLKPSIMNNHVIKSAEDSPGTSGMDLFPELPMEQIRKQLTYTEIA